MLWALAMVTAAAVGGAGHGWVAPLFVSIPLVFLYPLILVRGLDGRPFSRGIDGAILIVALCLDVLLAGYSLFAERGSFGRAVMVSGGAVAAWLALWLGWQILLIARLTGTKVH